MKVFLQLILFVFIFIAADSQENQFGFKNDSTILEHVSNHWRNRTVTYSMHDTALSKSNLIGILNEYPASAIEVVKYKKQKTAAIIMVPIILASTISAVIQADQKKELLGTNFSKAPVLYSISIGSLIGGIILSWNNHLHKAVNIYNHRN